MRIALANTNLVFRQIMGILISIGGFLLFSIDEQILACILFDKYHSSTIWIYLEEVFYEKSFRDVCL